jgi:deoxyribodipyrimidine photo-lyase
LYSEDLPFDSLSTLPDVFTSFRKSVEPLRLNKKPLFPAPSSLPRLPESIPPQQSPFHVPDSMAEIKSCLLKPLDQGLGLPHPPPAVESTANAHPFAGGSTSAHARMKHLIESGALSRYDQTRNEMLGPDFSTKLSAFLAIGCVSARQVHWAMYDFEEGRGQIGINTDGFGKGENKGTSAVRFELLWRDYMRLVALKARKSLFSIDGFPKPSLSSSSQDPKSETRWSYLEPSQRFDADPQPTLDTNPDSVAYRLSRFLSGNTGTGLIDAAQRELYLTGYVSNRARQNVASYLAKHLKIDWRLGAEWYETLLVDYDVASNWGNWQYVSGVGNDPRVERIFNPVKQALDYDPEGEYIKTWVPELRTLEISPEMEDRDTALMGIYQPWTLPGKKIQAAGLTGSELAEQPLLKINFDLKPKGKAGSRGRGGRGRGSGRGGGKRGGDRNWRRKGEMDKARGASNSDQNS